MKEEKISNIEAIVFLVMICLNNIILSSSGFILKSCGSSSILNALFITIITLFITFLICLALKQFKGKNLLDLSNLLGGKFLKTTIGLIFVIYFTFRASIFLKKISECLQVVYYPMTNSIFIIASFCIATGIVFSFKRFSIFKSSAFVVPILLISIILIFIGNSQNFSVNNMFPILGNGINPTFISGIGNVFVFSSLPYLWFLSSKLKKPEKLTKVSIISVLISGIFLLFVMANIVFLFSDTLKNSELFPTYLSVRYIEFGTFFQRLDAVFLFLCTLGFIGTLCINSYAAIDVLRNITNISDSMPIVFPYLLTIFGCSLLIKENNFLNFLEYDVSRISFWILGIVIPLMITIFAIIKRKKLERCKI